jgi:hypothetical protein
MQTQKITQILLTPYLGKEVNSITHNKHPAKHFNPTWIAWDIGHLVVSNKRHIKVTTNPEM